MDSRFSPGALAAYDFGDGKIRLCLVRCAFMRKNGNVGYSIQPYGDDGALWKPRNVASISLRRSGYANCGTTSKSGASFSTKE